MDSGVVPNVMSRNVVKELRVTRKGSNRTVTISNGLKTGFIGSSMMFP